MWWWWSERKRERTKCCVVRDRGSGRSETLRSRGWAYSVIRKLRGGNKVALKGKGKGKKSKTEERRRKNRLTSFGCGFLSNREFFFVIR